jgi:hypothetical protein
MIIFGRFVFRADQFFLQKEGQVELEVPCVGEGAFFLHPDWGEDVKKFFVEVLLDELLLFTVEVLGPEAIDSFLGQTREDVI